MPADRSARPAVGDDTTITAVQGERLRHELAQALEHVESLQREFDELLADPDVIQEDRDGAARLLEHARHQLESARTAVARLDAGTYGGCARCGGEIGAERLAAIPDVTTCVTCAAR